MIQFDEKKHWYFDTESQVYLTSVTTILKHQNLAPDYSFVDEEILDRAIDRGNFIHSQIEKRIKAEEIEDCPEADSAVDLIKKEYPKYKTKTYSELPVVSRNPIFNYAGILDLLILDSKWHGVLIDFKTNKSWNRISEQYVRWQMSLYAYAVKELPKVSIDKLVLIRWKGEKAEIVEFEPIATEKIEEVLRCEANGEKYDGTKLIPMEDSSIVIFNKIIEAQKVIDQYKKQVEEFKSQIYDFMVKEDIWKGTNAGLTITRTKDSDRVTIDSKMLKEKHPGIAEECSKTTHCKGSIKIERTEESEEF